MHATPSSVTVELDNSIAGCIAKMLGFKNVAVGATPIKGKPEKTPYSMEALVEKNPEIILLLLWATVKRSKTVCVPMSKAILPGLRWKQ